MPLPQLPYRIVTSTGMSVVTADNIADALAQHQHAHPETFVESIKRLDSTPVPAKVKNRGVVCGSCGSTDFQYQENYPTARTQAENTGFRTADGRKAATLVFNSNFEWFEGDDDPGVVCASCDTAADLPDNVTIDWS